MSIPSSTLWSFVVFVLTSGVAVGSWRTESASVGVQRLVGVLALASAVSLVALGGIWPSVHTLMAMTVLPAVGLLAVRVRNPDLLRGPLVHACLRYAVVVPPVMWGIQAAWLLSRSST